MPAPCPPALRDEHDGAAQGDLYGVTMHACMVCHGEFPCTLTTERCREARAGWYCCPNCERRTDVECRIAAEAALLTHVATGILPEQQTPDDVERVMADPMGAICDDGEAPFAMPDVPLAEVPTQAEVNLLAELTAFTGSGESVHPLLDQFMPTVPDETELRPGPALEGYTAAGRAAEAMLAKVGIRRVGGRESDRDRIARDLGRVVVPWNDATRPKGFGASQAWSVVNDAMRLYCEARGIVAPMEDTETMEAGRFMEPAVRAWFGHRTGFTVRGDGKLAVRHPSEPWLFASPDGIVYDATDALIGGLELKCVSEWARGDWGADDARDLPEKYFYQVQVQMGVTGLKKVWLAALFGGNKARFDFTVDFDPEFFAGWVEVARALWSGIQAGNPPRVTGSDSSAAYLKARWREVTRKDYPPAPAEAVALAEQYLDSSEAIKPLEEAKKAAGNQLKDMVGRSGAAGLMLDQERLWSVTWAPDSNGERRLNLRRPKR